MSADAIRADLGRLRAEGARLRRRPASRTLDSLARVLDAWSDPASRWRVALLDALPDAAGFSPEGVREGLARGLAGWNGDALRALVARELGAAERLDAPGPDMVSGFDCTAVVLAGALPTPTLAAMIAPLVLRSPILVKPSSHDPVTAALVLRSIAETDPELGACVAVRSFASGDEAAGAALLEAPCIVASVPGSRSARACRIGTVWHVKG